MEKKWVTLPLPESASIDKLAGELNVSKPIAAILLQREIDSFQKAKDFFRPELSQLLDPFLMKDMEKAVDRLHTAIKNEEKILVYGDYDVDGTTSVALMYSFLHTLTPHVWYYIPDRYKEGYGISMRGIGLAAKKEFSLVIALDCGTKAIENIKTAKGMGLDFIICDHHQPSDESPEAFAFLNPKRADCAYPFKELSGCGVGFKLGQAYSMRYLENQEAILSFMDFCAISIAADIVPLTGENRVLAKFGLELIEKSPRPGIAALKKACNFNGKITISNVVFGIAPRINSAGRVSHAHNAVRVLVAENEEEAESLYEHVNQNNLDRKDIDAVMTAEALAMIVEADDAHKKSTVLFKQDWHKGVVGIVASRCIDHHHRPTIILTESEGMAIGSARSVKGYDVYEAIFRCEDLLLQYGGHKYAAGLAMEIDKLPEFIERFERIVGDTIADDMLIPKIEPDLEIHLDNITDKFHDVLHQMSPYGPMNMRPLFVSRMVQVVSYPQVLKGLHLKVKVKQINGGKVFTALGFGMAAKLQNLRKGSYINICYTLYQNSYNGVVSLSLNLEDVQELGE